MVSSSLVSRVSGFSVIREESLPSDHVPITVTLSLPGVDIQRTCSLELTAWVNTY